MDSFTGTQPVSERHALDIDALERFLVTNLEGFAGPLTVEQFKGGQSNPTYKLLTPEQAYVLRAKPGPAARLLPSAHAIDREFRVMRALGATDVPVAKMHLLCEDESVIGRAFYVMEFVEGRVLWDQSLPGMSNAERGAIYDEMTRVIAALHGVDIQAVGLDGFGRPGNYFERQIGRWSKQYKASADGAGTWSQPIPEMERLVEWLPAHIPAEDDYIRRYCERTGIASVADVKADWNFYLAYNLFRIAAIVQGIARRALDGTASSAQAGHAGAGARRVAALGWQFAQAA